jgi:hypothetical protein
MKEKEYTEKRDFIKTGEPKGNNGKGKSKEPIFDIQIHITKGYPENELYNQLDPDINTTKMKWMTSELDKNTTSSCLDPIILERFGKISKSFNNWTVLPMSRREIFSTTIQPCF